MKIALAIVSIILLFGCQSTANKFAGVCQIENSKDNFNNSNIVKLTDCWVSKGEGGGISSIKFSFQWNDANPEEMNIGLIYDSNIHSDAYTGFESIAIKVDGELALSKNLGQTVLSSSDYNTVSNTIYTKSRTGFSIPYSLFEHMMKSNDVRIRIFTNDGYDDYVFHEKKVGMTNYARYYLDEYYNIVKKLKSEN